MPPENAGCGPAGCRQKGVRTTGVSPLSMRGTCPSVPPVRGSELILVDSLSMFSLAGRRALVTGSSRGIGFGIAAALAGAGADVIINGRDEVALGEAASRLAEGGARVRAVAFDVT